MDTRDGNQPLTIHDIYAAISGGFRARRMSMFTQLFNADGTMNILDLGGDADTWESLGVTHRVTLVNRDARCLRGHQAAAVADALASPFRDRTFDVVFSNSLIEHLGSQESQTAFANEVRRLSRNGYFVQTPNKWFPIEPHYLAPLIQFVPMKIRPTVVRWMTPRGWITAPSPEQCVKVCQEIRLLDAREMRRMFPEAAIVRERFFGFTKSLIAVWHPNGHR